MEFEIQQLIMPEPIRWNYDEVKAWISESASKYATIVYTDDDIKAAKEDRATLNRMKKALNDRRIQIEKEYMANFAEFKAQVNEVIALIDEPAKLIDQRIKEYEQAKKDEKAEKIAQIFEMVENRPEWLDISQIWDAKWLNTSRSMKSIEEELKARVEGINTDLGTLGTLTDFGFEATEEYKRTLDINRAMAEGMRLAEIQKRKEEEAARRAEEEARRQAERERIEAERQQRAEEEARMAAERQQMQPVTEPTEYWEEPPKAVRSAQEMDMAMTLCFRVKLTTPQALELRKFFEDRGIWFEAVKE